MRRGIIRRMKVDNEAAEKMARGVVEETVQRLKIAGFVGVDEVLLLDAKSLIKILASAHCAGQEHAIDSLLLSRTRGPSDRPKAGA